MQQCVLQQRCSVVATFHQFQMTDMVRESGQNGMDERLGLETSPGVNPIRLMTT